MPMMRRGPLDRYPVEWVLRQASSHQASGSIEFHTSSPATFYLRGGKIYAAEPGVGELAGSSTDHTIWHDEAAARRHVVATLVSTLATERAGGEGWYYLDPLGQHEHDGGSWVWETATLLMDTRAKAHEGQTLAAWTDRIVQLHDTPAASVAMGADAWSVVVALAGSAKAAEVRGRLGWSPARLLAALSEIEQLGVLGPDAAWRPQAEPARLSAATPPPPSAAVRVPAGGADAMPSGRHTGPLAPPPVLPISSATGSKRRKLTGRRTTAP